MTSVTRILGAPSLYVQGPGALGRIGKLAAGLGSRVLLVSDPWVVANFAPRVRAILAAEGLSFDAVSFEGEVTPATVEQIAARARRQNSDLIIAAGGGKGVDAGKAVSKAVGARLVTLPTAASNDGATSRVFMLYDDEHRLISAERLPRNPDAVLVDTEILASAPPELLVSGIGDALVKRFEAEQCIGCGGNNLFGGAATLAARGMVESCDRILREHAVAALASAREGETSEAFEAVVEACILLAGIGFEGTGLSVAHSMTRGLSAVPATAAALHGNQVAYALLVQFVLEERSYEFLASELAFYRLLGLPTCLAGLGLAEASSGEVRTIAALTLKAPHIRNFERALDEEALVAAINRLECMTVPEPA